MRPPLAEQRVRRRDERTYLLRTSPDPATGATQLALDPLLCPQCQVEMKIVSVITEPVVIDAGGGHDPHAPRAPPAA